MRHYVFLRPIVPALLLAGVLSACGRASPSTESGTAANTTDATTAANAANADTVTPIDASALDTSALDTPDFAEGTINAVAFEGSYACDPGFAPQITFSDDGTEKVFRAYLDSRLLTNGPWSWDGTTLRIESPGGSFAFTDVAIGDGTLTLGRGEAQWVCRHLPDETP